MARPRLKADERRTERLESRCLPEERQRVTALADACRLSVSDYVRTIALNGTIKVVQTTVPPADIIRDLQGIAVNMNQIAAKLNATGQHVPDRLLKVLDRMDAYLDEVQGIGAARHDR